MKKYLCLSDFHIPDHNVKLLPLIYRLINDLRPDAIYLLGDVINFTKVSKYVQDPHYNVDIDDEIREAKEILKQLKKRCENVIWIEGNHCARLTKYLACNAAVLATLEIDNEDVISIPHLFSLRDLGITWIGQHTIHQKHHLIYEHGERVNKYAGMTAKNNLLTKGVSVIQGHSHRLSLVNLTQSGKQLFGIENGCMCNLKPTPCYAKSPDWQNGFSVIYVKDDVSYPVVVPIIKNSFLFEGKFYENR